MKERKKEIIKVALKSIGVVTTDNTRYMILRKPIILCWQYNRRINIPSLLISFSLVRGNMSCPSLKFLDRYEIFYVRA